MAAARKRPELASVTTTFLPTVPQVFVDVDRDKVLKQGVTLQDVYQTLQCFMGGAVRELLQPLRPPVAGLRAGRGRLPHATPKTSASSMCATTTATWCRSLR